MPDPVHAPRALIFGSIGTLAETSDLQRRAFNAAFLEAGLAWQWSPEDYRALLTRSGGRRRIGEEAARRGAQVDAQALHVRKSEIFRTMMGSVGLPLRSGVAETVLAARGGGVRLALATTTVRATVETLLARAGPPALADMFDAVLAIEDGVAPKPDGEVYARALERLGCDAASAIAIEDSPQSAAAARAAGIAVVAFPGAYHEGSAFPGARAVVERLTPEMFGLNATGTVARTGP